ncbi:MAG: AAA family ATPase [Spirochaetia bacterium]|nr:AAA family ATPase [Spirochaetia bacterium]
MIKMENKEKIKLHLKANVPLLIYGESGWGKSSIVSQVAEELNLPMVIANVNSWTAEDFGGLVRPSKCGKFYDYLPPKWVVDNKDREFLFFIDEINQANISVLHSLYRIVLDREVAGIKLNMKIIACGNLNSENPYLTDLPEPLLKRFSTYTWQKDITSAVRYLNNKFKTKISKIYTNPRQTEMALSMLRVGDMDAVRDLGGLQLIKDLEECGLSKGEELVQEIEMSEIRKRNGIL